MQAYGKNRLQEAIRQFRILNPLISDINRIYPGQRLQMFNDQPESPPNLLAETETPFQQAAKILHARLIQNGDFFFPREGASDFQLDLRRFPIMDLQDGHRILFNLDSCLQPSELLTIKRYWTNLHPIVLSLPTHKHRILEAVQAGTRTTAAEVYRERTPVSASTMKAESSSGRIICIHAETQFALVEQIISCLGLIWHRQAELSFPYAGVQIRALSNLIDVPDGMPVLVDFGQFSGDAEAALQSNGFNVAAIQGTDSGPMVLEKIFTTINKSNSPAITIRPYLPNPPGVTGYHIIRPNAPDILVLMEPLDLNQANALIQDGFNLIVPPHARKGSLCATNKS